MKQVLLILTGVIIGYVLMSQIKGCVSGMDSSHVDTVYKRDTVWQHYDTTVKKPMVMSVSSAAVEMCKPWRQM